MQSISDVGGKERIAINLINFLSQKDYNICIITFDGSTQPFFPINENIKIKPYRVLRNTKDSNLFQKLFYRFLDLYKFRKIILEDNSKIIITTDYLGAIYSKITSFSKSKLIFVWEHSTYLSIENKFWQALRNLTYKNLDLVICINPTESKYYQSHGCNSICIYNYIESKKNIAENSTSNIFNILSIGRLTYEKNFQAVIEIAKGVSQRNKNIFFTIIGEGPLKTQIIDNIAKNNLDKIVSLKPFTKEIESEYQNSNLLLLTSIFECFPTVLLEALSMNIPCISFDCPTGPKYIIDNNRNGYLIDINNYNLAAQLIIELYNNKAKYYSLKSNTSSSLNKFSKETIFQEWILIFDHNLKQTR